MVFKPSLVAPALLIVAIPFLSGGCSSTGTGPDCGDKTIPPLQFEKVTIEEGIWGQLSNWVGNFMPSTTCTGGSVSAVQRTVLIFEATPDSLTTQSFMGFFLEVRSELVDSVSSDPTGFFEIALPPGTYSLFVREDSLLWANRFKDGIVNPIVVIDGQITSVEVRIDHSMVI